MTDPGEPRVLTVNRDDVERLVDALNRALVEVCLCLEQLLEWAHNARRRQGQRFERPERRNSRPKPPAMTEQPRRPSVTATQVSHPSPLKARRFRTGHTPHPRPLKEATRMSYLSAILGQAPAVHPQSPPGYEKVSTIVDWVAKLSITACVVGVLVTAFSLAVQHHRGTLGPDTGGRLGVVLGACVLIGVASQLVNSLV